MNALTQAEREAAAWAVEHLMAQHDYSSLLSRDQGRVDLEELRDKLLAAEEPTITPQPGDVVQHIHNPNPDPQVVGRVSGLYLTLMYAEGHESETWYPISNYRVLVRP